MTAPLRVMILVETEPRDLALEVELATRLSLLANEITGTRMVALSTDPETLNDWRTRDMSTD